MNIEISKQGFISDAAYSFYLSSLVQEYEDKFPLLEVLKVIIKELPYQSLSLPRKKGVEITEDKKTCTINFYTSKYYNEKGVITNTPAPHEVVASLRYLIEKAVLEFDSK